MTKGPDLEALFSAPPERFVALRNDLAAEAKANGRTDLMIRIKSMKRPSIIVWLANALAREHPEQIASVLAAGKELRDAYASGDVAAVRKATQARHQAVAAALRQAHAVLERAGRKDAADRGLAATLIGASLDPAQGKLLTEGRLQTEISRPSLEGAFSQGAPSPKLPPREPRAEHDARADERAAEKRAREAAKRLQAKKLVAAAAARDAVRLEKAAAVAQARAEAAMEEAKRARQKATEARRRADERDAEVRSLSS